MTITEFEEHDESAKQQSCEHQDFTDTTEEIKFGMHPIKDAIHTSVHDRLKVGLATDPSLLQQNHSSITDRLTSSIPRLQSPLTNRNDNLSNRPSYSNDVTNSTRSALKFDPSTVLPARTRIRRQRRLESCESEDPIERLNKLRARISGALSEVKGVLNKYSTETEPKDEAISKYPIIKPNFEVPPRVEEQKDSESAPVQFRFVKKLRRRSIFSEDGEKTSIEIDNTKQQNSEKQNIDDMAVKQTANVEMGKKRSPESNQTSNEEVNIKPKVVQELSKKVIPTVEVGAVDAVLSKKAEENVEKPSSKIVQLTLNDNNKNEKRRTSIGTIDDIDFEQTLIGVKTQRRPSDSFTIIGKLTENDLKPFQNVNEKTKNEFRVHKNETKPSELSKAMSNNKKTPDNKLSIKNRDHNLRRSSIAIVESSNMEPPIADNIFVKYKTERRPSDSEAIIMKGIQSNGSLLENKTGRVPNNLLPELSKQVVKNNAANLSATVKNRIEDDAKTSSVPDKQSAMTPISSIKTISNETSKSTSMLPTSAQLPTPSQSLLATVIGSSTTATTTTQTIATKPIATVNAPHEKIEYSNYLKHSKLPLTTDGPKVAGVAAVSNLSQLNATSSQQTQLNKFPNDQSIINGLSTISLDKNFLSKTPTDNIEPTYKESNRVSQENSPKAEQQEVKEHPVTATNDAVRNTIDVKNLIHQQGIRPTLPTEVIHSSVQEILSQAAAQQVAASVELAFNATGNDTCVREKSETITRKSLSEINASKIGDTANDVATKASGAGISPNSGVQSIKTESIEAVTTIPISESEKPLKMPELQLQLIPVALIAVHHGQSNSSPDDLHPFDGSKEPFHKKKFKKIIRKAVNNEKQQHPKEVTIHTDKIDEEINKDSQQLDNLENHVESANEISATESSDSTVNDENIVKPKAERKIKKKVIIKRVQRKLSGSEQSFFFGSIDEKPTADVETIEKTIAYVTDDDDVDEEDFEQVHAINPAKSCMRLREYQVGDLVMYAERYKKTQLRWKKGRITERITSISYKVDIGGKEVSAHINYLKKFTGRKVRFGDKEYLDIDYEQIPEEETKTQKYSIWNVV